MLFNGRICGRGEHYLRKQETNDKRKDTSNKKKTVGSVDEFWKAPAAPPPNFPSGNLGGSYAAVQDFFKNSAAPKHILAFLKHILIERLKLPEESVHPAQCGAGLVGLHLSNGCSKEGGG